MQWQKLLKSPNFMFLAPILILAYCFLYWCVGERLPVNDGLGWDGIVYGAYAQNFGEHLRSVGIDDYHINRLLPSLLVYSLSHLINYPLATPARIFNLFVLYNSILLTVAGFLWVLIARRAKFLPLTFWLGFVCLFVNYACLKQYQYASIQTDVTAFFFGTLCLYLYVAKRPLLILFTSFIASFAWPLVMYLAWLWLLNKEYYSSNLQSLRLDKQCAYVAFILFLFGVIYFNLIHPHPLINGAAQISKLALPLSTLLAGLYVFYVAKYCQVATYFTLIAAKEKFYDYVRYLCYYLFFLLLYFLCIYLIKHIYGVNNSFGLHSFFATMFVTPVAKPGIFLIAHLVFFGPAITMLLFFRKSIISSALENGFGIYGLIIVTFVMALNSESRLITFTYPLLIFVLCKSLSKVKMTPSFLLCFTLLSLVVSKIYIVINTVPLEGSLLEFPFQRLFMNFGPWMSWPGYFWGLLLFLLSFLVTFIFLPQTTVDARQENQRLK